jgi:FKBP-type peptidyl-prolyl cis-trans isomerase
MYRILAAAAVALFMAACSPSARINAEDPYSTLQPWNHKWSQIQRVTPEGKGVVQDMLTPVQFLAETGDELVGGRFAGAELRWTKGANEGTTSVVNRQQDNAFELAEQPAQAVAAGDTFELTGKTIEYIVIKKGPGTGPKPERLDTVTVMYDGRLAVDGKQFDSSYERGEPASFQLNQVIAGWTEGLQDVREGDEVMFWIPSALGYGPDGAGEDIPPNSDLMFRVALQKVTPAAASDPKAWAKVTPWPTDSAELVRTASGIEYLVAQSGDVAQAPAGPSDYAIVHFRGLLEDGSEAVSTFESQQPQIFPIEQLVPGWAETLQLMRPGDRWMVRMPASTMYGEEGDGRYPPNAPVVFEILVNDIIRVPTGDAAPPTDAPQTDAPQ